VRESAWKRPVSGARYYVGRRYRHVFEGGVCLGMQEGSAGLHTMSTVCVLVSVVGGRLLEGDGS
jgi:hypothetical protein